MSSPRLDEQQQQEADRRAKFVNDLMIGKYMVQQNRWLFLHSRAVYPFKPNNAILAYSYFLLLNADNAPAAIVGLVGTKEYDQCAKDLYYFLQVVIFLRKVTMPVISTCSVLSWFF